MVLKFKIKITNSFLLSLYEKIKNNPGAPFIFCFIIVLMTSPILLMFSLTYFVTIQISMAFNFLIIGIFIELYLYIKGNEREDNEIKRS